MNTTAPRPRRLPWRALLITAMLFAVLPAGCRDEARSEDAHRARFTALEVRHEAVAVARRMARRPEPRCGSLALDTRIERWGTFTTTLEARLEPLGEAAGADALPPLFSQLVRLRRDAAGNLAVVELLDHALGELSGQRSREVRLVDGVWQLREDGQPFVEQVLLDGGLASVAEAVEGYDRVLAALGPLTGDARTPEGLQLAPDDAHAPLRCELYAGARRLWVDVLGADWQPLSARAQVEPGDDGLPVRRTLEVELELVTQVAGGRRRGEEVPRVRLWLEERSRPGVAEPVSRSQEVARAPGAQGFGHGRALLRERWRAALVPSTLR